MPTPTWPASPDHQWLYEEGSGSVAAAAAGGKTGEVLHDDDTWRADGIAGSHSVRGGDSNSVRFSTASGNFFGIGANWSGAALVKIANDTDTDVHILSSDRTTHPTTAGDNDGWSWSLLGRKQYLRIETHKTGGFSGFSGSRGYLHGDNNIPRQEWVLVVFSAGPDGGQMINYSSAGKDKETWAFPFIVNNWGGDTGHFTHILRNGSPTNTWSDGGARIDAASFYHRYVAEGEWDTLAASLGLYASETYDATPNVTEIARTRTITFDIDTTDVADETDLYYTLDGTVTTDDVVGGSLSGTFEINDDTGQFEIEIESDATIGRTIIAEIRTVSIAGTVVDTAETVTIVADDFDFVPDVTDADEGDTVTYTLTTAGIPDGDFAYWGFVGGDVTAGDLVDFGPDAAIEINNNTATVEFELREDITTEGAEEMIVGIYTDAGKTNLVATAATVTIGDTSTLEGYTFQGETIYGAQHSTPDNILPSIGASESGLAVGILITADPGMPPDSTVNYIVVGDLGEDDYTVSDNAGRFTSASGYTEAPGGFTLVADALTEGTESFYIECYVNGDLVYTTPTINVLDTSQAAPTYAASVSDAAPDEGDTITITADCTTVVPPVELYYKLSADSTVTGDDFTSGNDYGSFTVDSGDLFNSSGSFDLTLVADLLSESLNLADSGTAEAGATFTLQDTDKTWTVDQHAGKLVRISAGTGIGQKRVIASNDSDTLTVGQAWATAPDATSQYQIIVEFFAVTIRTGSTAGPVVATTEYIIANDTSLTVPTLSVVANKTADGEGGSVQFTVTTEHFLDANAYFTITGTASEGDFTGAISGAIALTETIYPQKTGQVTLNFAYDESFEGTETFIFQLRTVSTSGTVVATAGPISILDENYSITVDKTDVKETQSVLFTFLANNADDDDTHYWVITGSVAGSDFTVTDLSGTVSLSGGTATLSKTLADDATNDGLDYFYVELHRDATDGPLLAVSPAVIVRELAIDVDEFDATFGGERILLIEMDRNGGDDGDTGTAEAGASTTLQDTDKSWTTDEHARKRVRITAGTGIGQHRVIASNTSDTLTVTAAWTDNPDATSEYEILLTAYISNHPYTSLPTDTNPDRPYDDIIEGDVELRSRIDSALVYDNISVLNDGTYDAWIGYTWRGYDTRYYEGRPDWSRDDFLLGGLAVNAGPVNAEDGVIVFGVQDTMVAFEKPLQTDFLSDGRPVPFTLGKPFNVPAVLITPADHEYQVHEGGLVSVAVRDNGLAVASPTLNLSIGGFELSASEAGNIAADPVTSTTTIPACVAAICNRFGKIADSASIGDLPAYEIGLFYDAEVTGNDVLANILQSVGAYPVPGADGEIEAYVLTNPAETPDVTLHWESDIVDNGVRFVSAIEPALSVTLRYNKNYAPATRDSIAGSVKTGDAAFASKLEKQWSSITVDNDVAGYPDAKPVVIETYLIDDDDASDECDRLAALMSVRREIWQVECLMAKADAKEGKTVEIIYPAWGFETGRNALITAVKRVLTDGYVVLEVYAPEVAE